MRTIYPHRRRGKMTEEILWRHPLLKEIEKLKADHLAALAEKEKLIGQLQDGLHNLKIMKDAEIESKNEQLCAVIKSSRKVIAELRQVIKAQERLLVSYRVGGRGDREATNCGTSMAGTCKTTYGRGRCLVGNSRNTCLSWRT
jgi:hypothetical protein